MTRVASPSPLHRLGHVSATLGVEVFVKREDLCAPGFGGNKARKLAPLLRAAQQRNATDLVTVCAVGAHQLAALAHEAVPLGFEVHAVLVPAPHTPRGEALTRYALAGGVQVVPASSETHATARAVATLARLRATDRRPLVVPPGATDLRGRSARAYLDAGREALGQIDARPGEAEPIAEHVCVLGSGGTCAGIWAAACEHAGQGYPPARVRGVRVYPTAAINHAVLYAQMCQALGRPVRPTCPLVFDDGAVGRGYGWPSPEGDAAIALFAQDGVRLDPIYTAKAAAALIAAARTVTLQGPVLFWHTAPGLELDAVDLGAALPADVTDVFAGYST